MSTKSILRITDCIDTINFLSIDDGFLVCDWIPAVAQFKDGGVWQSSPLVDGKRMAYRNFDNAVETFNFTIKGSSQDAVIAYVQSLTTMLEKAVSYWMNSWQKQPVWIEARGATETNSRFAVIKSYKIEELANPYSQPFFGGCKSLMNKFTVVIERDHWIDQVPGTAVAIGLNNLQNYLKTDTVTIAKSCMQPADDALNTNSSTSHTITPTASYNRVGIAFVSAVNTYYDCGLRFPSINIPQGATILQANLQVTAFPASSAGIVLPEYDEHDLTMWIYGELVANAPIFNDSVSDYTLRHVPLTSVKTEYISPATTWRVGNETKYINGLASVIQEIVNQHDWASGNAIALWFMLADLSHEDNYRSFGTVDNGFPPILNITYTTVPEEGLAGHEDTTSGNVYIANKHNQAQITHIFTKPSGGALSGNLVGTALPWTLLPSPPADGDEIYFGITDGVNTCGPFDNVVVDISVIGENYDLDWYHSDGAGGWTSSLVYSDKSTNFGKLGEAIIYTSLYTGGKNTVGTVTGYFIKAVVTNATGVTVAPQQETREIYTCITPFVDIDGSDILGEISALARVRVTNIPIYPEQNNTVIVGSRSKSRGSHFTPYLNFSDVQNIAGVSSQYTSAMVTDVTVPTGRCISYTYDAEVDAFLNTYAQIAIDASISGEYQGTFHVYLRYRQTIGSNDDFDIRLRYSTNYTGSWIYIPSISSRGGGEAAYSYVADFGIIKIGSSSLAFDDNLGNIIFEVQCRHNVDTSSTIKFQDLILIPCDEWFGCFQASAKGSSGDLLIDGKVLDIDSIGNPRTSRAILRYPNIGELLGEQFSSEWIKMTRGGPFLQSQADQRLWFLTYYDYLAGADADVRYINSYIYHYQKVNAYIANRYLTMRGAI